MINTHTQDVLNLLFNFSKFNFLVMMKTMLDKTEQNESLHNGK